MGAIDPT